MVNPTEDIVNIWLQECKNHFTMGNIVVPKKPRKIDGRKIYGGRGKEIDLLSTDGKKFYWIEVSVSPSPYLLKDGNKVGDVIKKFAKEKQKYLKDRFGRGKQFQRWFIYSPRLFSKKSGEEGKYCSILENRGIKAISFKTVLEDLKGEINYMGYDLVRNYLFLLKRFNWGE